MINPIQTGLTINVNESFSVSYGTFKDNASLTYSNNSFKFFPKKQFIEPVTNQFVNSFYNNSVPLECYEHVNLCVAGNAKYKLSIDDQLYEYDFNLGDHNIDNGIGYVPAVTHTLESVNNFTLCCLYQTFEKDPSIVYNFEIIKQDTTLDKNINFAHVAYGAISIGDEVYTQQSNIYNLPTSTKLSFAGDSIVILGYTI